MDYIRRSNHTVSGVLKRIYLLDNSASSALGLLGDVLELLTHFLYAIVFVESRELCGRNMSRRSGMRARSLSL